MVRQLDLFNKRLRGRRPPPPSEFSIHCTVADACKWFLSPQWEATHLPMGETRDHRVNRYGKRYSLAGSRLKRMGVMPGWPDFMFLGPGRVFFLELKRPKRGRLSEDQQRIAQHIMRCGFGYLCTDSVDDAIATLRDLGILLLERRRIPHVNQQGHDTDVLSRPQHDNP